MCGGDTTHSNCSRRRPAASSAATATTKGSSASSAPAAAGKEFKLDDLDKVTGTGRLSSDGTFKLLLETAKKPEALAPIAMIMKLAKPKDFKLNTVLGEDYGGDFSVGDVTDVFGTIAWAAPFDWLSSANSIKESALTTAGYLAKNIGNVVSACTTPETLPWTAAAATAGLGYWAWTRSNATSDSNSNKTSRMYTEEEYNSRARDSRLMSQGDYVDGGMQTEEFVPEPLERYDSGYGSDSERVIREKKHPRSISRSGSSNPGREPSSVQRY